LKIGNFCGEGRNGSEERREKEGVNEGKQDGMKVGMEEGLKERMKEGKREDVKEEKQEWTGWRGREGNNWVREHLLLGQGEHPVPSPIDISRSGFQPGLASPCLNE
jgi:hypothetical protein